MLGRSIHLHCPCLHVCAGAYEFGPDHRDPESGGAIAYVCVHFHRCVLTRGGCDDFLVLSIWKNADGYYDGGDGV